MPETTITTFQAKRLDILNEKGEADASLMPSLTDEEIRGMYEALILCRIYDQRSLSLQREGRIGTYASILGQEASQVGSAFAVGPRDWVFPSFRESGVNIALNYPLFQLFLYWAGDERGNRTPEGMNIFPLSIPVGTQIPHAAGVAMAMKYRKDDAAVVCYFGDGGTSKGDFHEGFNMAGVFRLPVVYICQNNQWAISVPVKGQTASETLSQKAFAYGFEGIQVDGNDVFAVYKATRDALEKARRGGGPTFIECYTYRISDHTTADDASRYRPAGEVEAWKKKDPILRLRLYMEGKGLWTEAYEKDVSEKAVALVDAAVQEAESLPPPQATEMFTYTYEKLTPRQMRERKGL